ncbi:Crp/Fnr family transcriptional regulator [Octadecabacter sp. 1_MG-2023]|uniref:Crp/Fnr family transcriptional regulator n=1 Tax=unclassified Octadecabacter TaxID=196158 RepID=UPI001C095405|nr:MULTISPECIES: Crp/Fnr family transcriptional regulator [unclassified Octadecabacter]MBU2994350.1 Crp/Fnr family transcriptional regulator [Octadecabacter sp. B2R22]MDO6734361.1 Crp/Fnr family transcriptional regulator [Octadecabacter sp. 1_MG-2023]
MITLPKFTLITYDLDHMLPDPFSHLSATACRTIDMQKGDVLFRQSQTTSGLYRVVSGCVTLQRTGLGGDTLTLHRAMSGGFFAEASVFSATYHCDAVCTEAGSVTKIAKANVVATMHSNPAFSEGFTKLLAVQVQQYRAHIELLAIPSAKERILAAVQAGYFDTTVIELATRINLTHEACYRALRGLCDEGLMVRVDRGKYVLS